MTTEEMLLQLIEGQKETNKRLDKIEDDLDEIKEKCDIAYAVANHNGEVLEQMVKDLAPLNMLNVKY